MSKDDRLTSSGILLSFNLDTSESEQYVKVNTVCVNSRIVLCVSRPQTASRVG